jgi:hypothetical protein
LTPALAGVTVIGCEDSLHFEPSSKLRFWQRHGAGFVLEDFEAGEGTGGHREGFLDCASFKLPGRSDLSDPVPVKM